MKGVHLDIETAYTVGAVWGMFEQDLAAVLSDEYVLGVGFSYEGEEKVSWKGLPDFPTYKKDRKDDRALMEFLWKLLDEADYVVAHNGRAFDLKKIRARMIKHGMPPFKEPRIIDTKLEFRKKAAFISNKLDELSRQILGERKIKHSGIELWTRCMADKYDKAAWTEMATYCKKDVVLLKKLYEVIRPWMETPPNWNLEEDRPPCCPACGGLRFYKHGLRWNNTTVQQKYRCLKKTCRHMFGGKSVPRKYKDKLDKASL